MSKLDRMNLVGIRSFGPEDGDVQKIKFESPLTLIQGQNGCGKTTIIEAIKFGITGELPAGTSKGQGFVYDPKLAKAFESLGKVKLRVVDSRGGLVTVMKVVRVTQKGPDKLEFKRLDSTISRGTGNDPMHASNRCADVDQEMCLVLGVSKPIINQVLFCHQEDSNWPLEESKKLKERFDDIFDAAKYNKCLDHITKKIKEKVSKFKIMEEKVKGLKDIKENVENIKLKLQDKKEKNKMITEKIAEFNTKLKPINDRINELYEIEQNFTRLYTNIELKKKELEYLNQQQNEIKKNTTEFKGSDHELNEKVAKFENEIKSFEDHIEILKRKKQQFVGKENDLGQTINQQQNKLGSLQSENDHNLKNTNERNHLILSAAKDFGLKNIEIDDDETDINHLINQLKKCFVKNEENVNAEQKQMENKEDEMQKEIDSAREENAQLNENIKSKGKQLQEMQNEMRTLKHKLEELNTADDQLKLSENKLQRLEREIKALESSIDTDKLKQQIETEKSKLKTQQDRNVIVDNEIRELQQYTNIQTELDVKNENLLCKQNELKKLMNKHDTSLLYIFENNIPKTNLKSSIESHIKEKRIIIKNLTSEVNDKQKNVLKLENVISSSKEKLNEKEQELSNNIKKIQQFCDDEPLEEVVEKINNKLKQLHDNRGSLASSTYLYKNFIKKFQEDHPCCPLCKRNVEQKSAAQQIIEDIKKQIENIPNELNKLDLELKSQQKTHEKLISLLPLNEKNKTLESEIPILQTQLQKNKRQLDAFALELNNLKLELTESQKNLDRSNAIVGDVCLIDQCQKEMSALKQQIMGLEKRMPNSGQDYSNKRGIDEAMCERETLNHEIRSIANNIESHQTKLSQHTERLHVRKEEKNEILSQQLTIKKNLQDKDHLVTKSIEIEDKIITLSVDIAELKEKTSPMLEKLNKWIKQKEDLKIVNRKKRDLLGIQINKEQKKIQEITTLHAGIEKFAAKNIVSKMEAIVNEIYNYKQEIEKYTQKKTQIDAEIDDLKKKVTNGQMYYRELKDNVQLREKQKKSQKLSKEIEKEEGNLGQNDIKQIRNEKSQLIDESDLFVKQKHRKEGERTQLLEDITSIKKELSLPKNIKAADDYKQKHMEYLLLNCVILDLKEFIKAMDWSLMQYHKKRMVQINSIIKELWRSIYKGNDIDYVEIKTDDIKAQGTDKRKVYSYRVVQVKNDVELEMRGRCSAGQRVLASLVIRIALAETFSNNCGVLALDEPTTNLDRENINSLADALMELIQQKRQHQHFQLLIITHDQEFVDRLMQMESLEKYYEIKRNTSGKSVIMVHNRF